MQSMWGDIEGCFEGWVKELLWFHCSASMVDVAFQLLRLARFVRLVELVRKPDHFDSARVLTGSVYSCGSVSVWSVMGVVHNPDGCGTDVTRTKSLAHGSTFSGRAHGCTRCMVAGRWPLILFSYDMDGQWGSVKTRTRWF